MPTDLDDLITAGLMFVDTETGEKHKFGQLKDIQLSAMETEGEPKYLDLMKGARTFSCSIQVKRSSVYLLDIRIGAKYRVPNNWLKRHKFPMNRRLPDERQ